MNHFAKIAAQLESRDLDGMLLTHEANRFYASGFHSAGTDGMALVTREKFYYFTDSRYTEAARRHVQDAEGQEAGHGRGYSALLMEAVQRHSIQRLGFEDAYMTVREHDAYARALPCELVPAADLLAELRAVKDPEELHESLRFLLIGDEYYVPLILQLLLVELIIDVLKLASLNTPDTLSNSFSMLGALILGDFAVQAGWLGPEVLVYMAFVSVASFAQPSYEMGYAFKLLRVVLLLITALFDVWGFVLGCLGILVLLATTKPLVGKGYL